MRVHFTAIAKVLRECDPRQKCFGAAELWEQALRHGVDLLSVHGPDPGAGRPAGPELVPPHRVPKRGLGSQQGRAALVHAIAHIEFNAVNLALDAAWRFRDMPEDFYLDWLSVAADEARHFQMLEGRLEALGYEYGDFSAHNGLWEMAEKTAASCLERMALVPRVLEARGLDVTPGMIKRLRQAGDEQTVKVLEIILEEEVRHVEIGSRWFRYCCSLDGRDPESTFGQLLARHFQGGLRGPFNHAARKRAGFTEAELRSLSLQDG